MQSWIFFFLAVQMHFFIMSRVAFLSVDIFVNHSAESIFLLLNVTHLVYDWYSSKFVYIWCLICIVKCSAKNVLTLMFDSSSEKIW